MTAPPPLLSAGRADRTRRAASTRGHGPSKTARSTIRPTPCGPWPASGAKDQEAEWATSMRVGHQHALRASGPIMRMDQWSTCRTNHAAHAKAHVRAGIADHPDGPRSIRRTNQIRGPRESPCGDGHADRPWSMDRAGRWRPCPPGHGPRTIWAGRRVDPVHAVHGPRAHRHRAGLPKRTWSGAMRIARRARDRCRIPDSRRAGSRPWTSPRSAGAGTRRGRHARPPCGSRPRTNSGTTDTYAK